MKKENSLALIVVCILTVIGLAINVVGFINAVSGGQTSASIIISLILSILVYGGIIFYAIYGFKIPHGNVLKWIFILFALSLGYSELSKEGLDIVTIICVLFSVVSIAYVSGRLGRYNQNLVIVLVVAGLLLTVGIVGALSEAGIIIGEPSMGGAIYGSGVEKFSLSITYAPAQDKPDISLVTILSNFAFAIQWLALICAYLTRYESHKEAGLADK